MTELTAAKEFGTRISLISQVSEFVMDFLGGAGLKQGAPEILLAVEEWYVNIVKHGFHGKDTGHVKLIISFSDGLLNIEIHDDGQEFDPQLFPAPEKPKTLEEARIGGLGIHLIRNLMDETEYRRENGKNVFTMKKWMRQ